MSFSSEVKDELAKQISKSRHCQLAELAAIISFTEEWFWREKTLGLRF